jgi:hypothetical protein
LVLEIVFIENTVADSALSENDQNNNRRSIKIDLDKKYITLLQEQINVFKDKEINPSIRRTIALAKNSKLCIQCAENKYALEYKSDHNLCLDCFRRNYGKVILEAPNAEYYGGHKAYLGGGTFGKYQAGRLILSEHYIIFATEDNNPSKRWEIIIPLQSIIVGRWGIEEVGRRQEISGGGSAIDNFGFGGGTVHDSGKAHHLVVPYMDENGIPQEPRFGVSSFRGKAIREWAAKLYQQVVKEKTGSASASSSPPSQISNKNSAKQLPSTNTNQPTAQNTHEDPLKVLKMRFAKGEITKEEYEEMRKMLES